MCIENVRQLPTSLLQLLLVCAGTRGINGRGFTGRLVMNQVTIVVIQTGELCNGKRGHVGRIGALAASRFCPKYNDKCFVSDGVNSMRTLNMYFEEVR